MSAAVSPMSRPRILAVDDDPDLLALLTEWFDCCGYEVATARDGVEAVTRVKDAPFDIVITDLKMPGLSGLHLLSIIKELDPTIEVIVFSGEGTMEDAIEALKEGKAFDFLLKPARNLDVLNTVIEKAYARRLANRTAPRVVKAATPEIDPLTPRELEIMGLLALGLDNRAIADRLTISEKTAKNHLTRIYEKLKVKNRTQAVLLCQQAGMV